MILIDLFRLLFVELTERNVEGERMMGLAV